MHHFLLIFWHKDIFSQTSLKWVFMARIWHTHYCSKHSKDPVIVLLLNLEEMNLNLSVQCSQQSYLTKTSQHMYWHKDKHKKKKKNHNNSTKEKSTQIYTNRLLVLLWQCTLLSMYTIPKTEEWAHFPHYPQTIIVQYCILLKLFRINSIHSSLIINKNYNNLEAVKN